MRAKNLNWVNPAAGRTAATPNTTSGELAAALVAQERLSIDGHITRELGGLASFERAVEMTLNGDDRRGGGPPQMVL